jgi:hypothetical protein
MAIRFLNLCMSALVLSSGCSSTSALAPSQSGALRISVQATPTLVGSPDTATFTVRVENVSAATTDLTFPSSCQVLPYFVDRRTGQAVTPRGGGFVCLTVITHQTLKPGESFFEVITVKSGDAPQGDAVVLPAGDYAIYARMQDSVYKLLSDQLAFSVK